MADVCAYQATRIFTANKGQLQGSHSGDIGTQAVPIEISDNDSDDEGAIDEPFDEETEQAQRLSPWDAFPRRRRVAADNPVLVYLRSNHFAIADQPIVGKTRTAIKTFVPWSFPLFLELPDVLRHRIYAYALSSDNPILPHLCSPKPKDPNHSDDTIGVDNPIEIKFHDDNGDCHISVNCILGVTRVSKQVRNESLQWFYKANTFQIGDDTASYFDRLEFLGRFHMIHHVRIPIWKRPLWRTAVILRHMSQYIEEDETYLNKLRSLLSKPRKGLVLGTIDVLKQNDTLKSLDLTECDKEELQRNNDLNSTRASLIGSTYTSLTKSPQYQFGGLEEINTLIVLRKLVSSTSSASATSTSTSSSSPNAFRFVLPVPHTSIFTDRDNNPLTINPDPYAWFPATLRGLGIHLHVVPGYGLTHVSDAGMVITWHQTYGKKDWTPEEQMVQACGSAKANEVYQHALMQNPDLKNLEIARRHAYSRKDCKGRFSGWVDFDPMKKGGVGEAS